MKHSREDKKVSYFEREFMNAAAQGDAVICGKLMDLGVDIDLRVNGFSSPLRYILKTMDEKLILKALDMRPDLSFIIWDEEFGNMTYIDYLFFLAGNRWGDETVAVFKRLAKDGCGVCDYETAAANFKNLSEQAAEDCKAEIAQVLDRKMSALKKQLKRDLKKAGRLEYDKLVFDIARLIETDAVDVYSGADLKFKELVKGTGASEIVLKHKLGETRCSPNDDAVFEIGRAITQHKSCYA